jgi:hypothetical protein
MNEMFVRNKMTVDFKKDCYFFFKISFFQLNLNTMKRTIASILIFILLIAGYEYAVHLWSRDEAGVIIRVDIFLVYPIIVGVSIFSYYLLGKIKKT